MRSILVWLFPVICVMAICTKANQKLGFIKRNLKLEVLHQFWWKGVATLPWGARDIHLYFNQHYTYAPGAFLCTQHCRHVHSLRAGVFNLLKFDRIAKKKKKKKRYTSRVESPGLCCICEVRHGICQYYMGSSFHQGQWCKGESAMLFSIRYRCCLSPFWIRCLVAEVLIWLQIMWRRFGCRRYDLSPFWPGTDPSTPAPIIISLTDKLLEVQPKT